jgi:hypothetical protein
MSRPVSPKCAWPPIEAFLRARAIEAASHYPPGGHGPADTAHGYADVTGLTTRSIWRYRATGCVSVDIVELIADRIGVHPSELAGDYYTALPGCGTRASYKAGCTCAECRAANATYQRLRKVSA